MEKSSMAILLARKTKKAARLNAELAYLLGNTKNIVGPFRSKKKFFKALYKD